MYRIKLFTALLAMLATVSFTACDTVDVQNGQTEADAPVVAAKGQITVNGWYEGEEIYYIDLGVEEGVTELGTNDIYLIGGNRAHQANVVEFIPGEAGYTPHWNVHVVNVAEGVMTSDIVDAGFASEHFYDEHVLFDDVEDILAAEAAGLVTIETPGVVVLCPIISEAGAEAPGHTELPEDFPEFPDTF